MVQDHHWQNRRNLGVGFRIVGLLMVGLLVMHISSNLRPEHIFCLYLIGTYLLHDGHETHFIFYYYITHEVEMYDLIINKMWYW